MLKYVYKIRVMRCVMKLLVIGSGGREHAIAKKLLESKGVDQVLWHLAMMA